MSTSVGFCDPSECVIVAGRSRKYRTPDGNVYPSVTTVLKVLGLGTEALIAWSARTERDAVLEACADVFAERDAQGPAEFAALVEMRIGKAKQHQKLLAQGAEIGSQIHAEIQRRTALMLGQEAPAGVPLVDQAEVALMAWDDWLKTSGLKLYRAEQPVWDDELRAAGTIDALAYNDKGELGLIDYKSSRGIYDTHHVQVATYLKMARNFERLSWAKIVRLPKSLDDPAFEVKDLGEMYGGKTLTEEQLLNCFLGARMAFGALYEE